MSPKDKPTLPLAIYTRVSEQGDRSDEELLSHDIQRDKVELLLKAHGIPVSPITFADTDRSGRKMSRPQFDRALEMVRAGKLGGIAVYKLSRFGRNKAGVEALIYELEEMGATFVCVQPNIDTSTAMGRFMLSVFAAIDEMVAELGAEDAAVLVEKKLKEGLTLGGTPLLGYTFEVIGEDSKGKELHGWYIRDDPAATVVNEGFVKLDRRELTVGRVADFLNAAGLRTRPTKKHPDGKLWNTHSIKPLLRNKAYIGVRTYGDVEIEDAHEAIVDKDVFRRVQRRLEPKEGAGANTRVRGDGYVLGEGLVRCGYCGDGLARSTANRKYPTLRCCSRGHGHASISLANAEEHVVSVAFAHTGMAGVWDGGNADEIASADRLVESTRVELDEVEALKDDPGVSKASYLMVHSAAQMAYEAAKDARAELEPEGSTLRLLFPAGKRELYEKLAIPEKRAALRSIVKQVVVAPGRGHFSERLAIEFQDGTYHPADAAPGYVYPAVAIEAHIAAKKAAA